MLHRPIVSRSQRTVAALMLALSAALAIATLATRNLYDDELSSLHTITSSPRDVVRLANASDVHPPGMYLLTHFAFSLVPSFRWMNLIPLAVLYAGLAAFALTVAPLFRRTSSRLLFLALATLHPQLLLWGTSFRWYSWWTGLALIALVVALQPRQPNPTLSQTRAAAIGSLLGALFYLNYITLLLGPALAVAMTVRYRNGVRAALKSALVTVAVFAGVIAPQALVFLRTHLARSSGQRAEISAAFVRLMQGTFASEAYLPWHPLAVVTAITLASVLLVGFLIRKRANEATDSAPDFLRSMRIFTIVFFLLLAISGLGGRPRNGLLLAPCMAAVVAQAAERLSRRTQGAMLAMVVLWSAVGIEHMLTRTGLSRAMMIDRPEQVTAFIQSSAPKGCAVIVTSDAALAFAVSHSYSSRMLLLSPFTPPLAKTGDDLPAECSHVSLYIAHSYISGSAEWVAQAEAELDSVARWIQGAPQTAFFSPDPDAAQKRRLGRLPGLGSDSASAARVPDFRYTVVSGPIERSELPALESSLPDFCTPSECLTR